MTDEARTSTETVTYAENMTWKEALMHSPGPRSWLEALIIFIKGLCMGAADIVPGVSGGTIAFITGIYESFILSIASFNFKFVKRFFSLRWKEAISDIHLRFIVCLLAGIFLAIMCSASMVHYLMSEHPILTWAAFFGLIAGSILIVSREVEKWSIWRVCLLLMGTIGAWLICGLIPVSTPNEPWFMFICGIIGICAMVLPGLSGSFLLLILGKYYYITGALGTVNKALRELVQLNFSATYSLLFDSGVFGMLAMFMLGMVVGIIGFSRFLKWLLARAREGTMCVLTGLMIGAMRKIWPWKHTIELAQRGNETRIITEKLVFPWNYSSEFTQQIDVIQDGTVTERLSKVVSGLDPQTSAAVLLILAGFFLVLVLEYIAKGRKYKSIEV